MRNVVWFSTSRLIKPIKLQKSFDFTKVKKQKTINHFLDRGSLALTKSQEPFTSYTRTTYKNDSPQSSRKRWWPIHTTSTEWAKIPDTSRHLKILKIVTNLSSCWGQKHFEKHTHLIVSNSNRVFDGRNARFGKRFHSRGSMYQQSWIKGSNFTSLCR